MKYFTLKELTRATTATAKGIDNTPTPEVEKNLTLLVENVLDPLREIYGKPITVNSGYRCPELNKAVGGSKTSDHVKGFAADITGGSKEENERIFNIIKHNFHFKQLIDEKGFSWVHVSYDPSNLKNQILKL
ncbi:zinc D-Ala-D-Ala carboxypeptidase precursor [Bacteroides phage Barc2635]|nr:zinc D-Ala-D-Ala carboxypeptidase precursor [Bacteroides phage Barc2635]